MLLTKIPLADTRAFTPFFLDYIQQKETLKPFYHRFPIVQNFSDQIKEKSASFSSQQREILVRVLKEQYKNLEVSESVNINLSLLSDSKTFTVTTGHQLNIFTGPLYFIYKIITAINSCRQLKAAYPDYNFVPVYWMASEDHDYDEIKYFKLYGKKYVWETDQKGAVGRFDTKGIDALLNEVPGEIEAFRKAYLKNSKLSDAVRQYINEFFGPEGLVVVDADSRVLKSQLTKVIQEDVFNNTSKRLVEQTNNQLEGLGYKTQIHCRDINFFYLDSGVRGRIEKQGDRFQVLDTDISFTRIEIEKLIDSEPEKFSPNVILRPLYQEMILPNLAYVGGPAEVIYWLQLKEVFNNFKIPFPILMPRNFAVIADAPTFRKFEKTGLELTDLFEEKNFIFNHWVLKYSPKNLTVGAERTTILGIFQQLQQRAAAIDSTLSPFVGAEGKRVIDSLEKIEHRLLQAEKKLHADKFGQIEAVKDALFPDGDLQERTDNFLNFYQRDAEFIRKLIENLDPFEFQFNALIYNS